MPTRSSKLDLNQLAKAIVDETTGEAEPVEPESKKVLATRAAGSKGAKARAMALTPEQRADIARVAAQARWKKA
jgi:hypothetical protein